jgi:hypothetical protein
LGKSSLLRFNWFGYGRGNWSKPGYLSKGPETDLSASKLMREAIKNKESIKITILNYNKNKEKYWFESLPYLTVTIISLILLVSVAT